MFLAVTTPFSGYVLNILMQAATYAIAVIGLTVVLGLCGQINLAQAAFFGIGAYAVGLGTVDLGISFWLCLPIGLVLALVLGAVLGASTLRLGGHYLAMVTISFQQIVTLIMINWIPVTHGPDGVPNIKRPRSVRRRPELPRTLHRRAGGGRLRGLADAQDPARPRHAGGARQRTARRASPGSTSTAPR